MTTALLLLAQATFTKDVAPVLYKNCTACHRTNDIAPMSLETYKSARPWARAIRQAVLSRQMPPWHADPRYGHFENDRRLSEAEINTIKTWVDAGAPEGNPRDLPAAPVYSDDWKIGKPDLIVPIPEEYTLTATGPDEYTYFTAPTGLDHDVWVQAVELRPGNRKVVHHSHVWAEKPEPPKASDNSEDKFFIHEPHLSHIRPELPVLDDGCSSTDGGYFPGQKPSENGHMLGSYLPGRDPDRWPEGFARLIPAGSALRFQIHYSRTTGKPETDRSSVGFRFATAPPLQAMRRLDIPNFFFAIPAGEPNHKVTSCYTFEKDVLLTSYVAHMHYRGKDMRFDLVRPDGSRETLLSVPNYNFNWQTTYKLKEPMPVSKGSRVIITAHFDNSANNKFNPDPSKMIRWGEPSQEEMMDGWFEYYLPVSTHIANCAQCTP